MAREQSWMAEHMLILGLEAPNGKVTYMGAAFPSACGKTNLAMMVSALADGYQLDSGGGIIDEDRRGRLFARHQSGSGIFCGVAPGTGMTTNRNVMEALHKNTIFTNVAMTAEREPWWEGIGGAPPSGLINWKNEPMGFVEGSRGASERALHSASASIAQHLATVRSARRSTDFGVYFWRPPRSGLRRSSTRLLIGSMEYLSAQRWPARPLRQPPEVWVSCGATPWRCCPFAGTTWPTTSGIGWTWASAFLIFRRRSFHVNWFRKGADGKFLWPGFGDNMRVLKWLRSVSRGAAARRSDWLRACPNVLTLDRDEYYCRRGGVELLRVDPEDWEQDLVDSKEFFPEVWRSSSTRTSRRVSPESRPAWAALPASRAKSSDGILSRNPPMHQKAVLIQVLLAFSRTACCGPVFSLRP